MPTFAKLCFSVVLYCVVHSMVWRTPVQDLAATDWHFPRLDIRSSFLPAFVVTVVTISEVQRKKKNSCPFKEKEVYFSTSGNNRIKETLYVYYIILYIALTFFVWESLVIYSYIIWISLCAMYIKHYIIWFNLCAPNYHQYCSLLLFWNNGLEFAVKCLFLTKIHLPVLFVIVIFIIFIIVTMNCPRWLFLPILKHQGYQIKSSLEKRHHQCFPKQTFPPIASTCQHLLTYKTHNIDNNIQAWP